MVEIDMVSIRRDEPMNKVYDELCLRYVSRHIYDEGGEGELVDQFIEG